MATVFWSLSLSVLFLCRVWYSCDVFCRHVAYLYSWRIALMTEPVVVFLGSVDSSQLSLIQQLIRYLIKNTCFTAIYLHLPYSWHKKMNISMLFYRCKACIFTFSFLGRNCDLPREDCSLRFPFTIYFFFKRTGTKTCYVTCFHRLQLHAVLNTLKCPRTPLNSTLLVSCSLAY